MVEPRLIYAASMWYMWVGQRLYKGHYMAFIQPEGRSCTVGKRFYAVDIVIDCIRSPTYRTGSSEDHAGCCILACF